MSNFFPGGGQQFWPQGGSALIYQLMPSLGLLSSAEGASPYKIQYFSMNPPPHTLLHSKVLINLEENINLSYFSELLKLVDVFI